jgi:hypothetical protein
MNIMDIEPTSLLGFIGAELFNANIRRLAATCETRREFNRAMEREILPAVRATFDDRTAHDVLKAAREVYGRRGEEKERQATERPPMAPAPVREAGRACGSVVRITRRE